jgi:eukaryotic-like serine/threonine-protein kinase
MNVDTTTNLLDALSDADLLRPEQLAELSHSDVARGTDPKELARDLLRRGWLTKFQLAMALHGRAGELTLGPYRLLERLGAGGMGEVYKARQTKLNRTIALKVVRPELLKKPLVLRRFRREAQAAGRLDHPNIVRVYDAESDGDLHFLVMEYVPGVDLSRYLKARGPLSVPQACDIARQMALGLQHAHDKHLVHRDIKPQNVLIDGQGVVKLLDMGLARATTDGPDPAGSGELTQADMVIGTPDFMAPEQARDSRTVDARADLYSLGCTLYFLLTGRTPFPGGTAVEKLLKHQTDPPPNLLEQRPDAPPTLAAVLEKLLAKRTDDRYPSAAAVAAVLAPFAAGDYPAGFAAPAVEFMEASPFVFETPHLLPTVALKRSRPRPVPRRRWLALAGLLLAGVVLAAVAGLARRSAEARPAEGEVADKPAATKPAREKSSASGSNRRGHSLPAVRR